jgi:membrane-bound metal-dependent hydrolase YbcI (DUF457 family)
VALGIIAVIFFAIFLAWELTEEQPIVDLRVFRHRGFTVSTLSLALTYDVFSQPRSSSRNTCRSGLATRPPMPAMPPRSSAWVR